MPKDYELKTIPNMNENIQQTKLNELNADYTQIKGQPFSHFFCPILFKDEDTALCKAHIVNQAFPGAPQDWTIQLKDVDNFYGAYIESEFVALQHRNQTHGDIITNHQLSKSFKPQILVDDKPVDFFVANGKVPKNFTSLQFDNNGIITDMGLKISPKDFLAAKDKNWQVSVEKDIRVPALVSLIKAAHLTLFEMLGYKYAFSAGGYFVGRHILGEFYLQNRGKTKKEILTNANSFFKEFAHMVRPLQSSEIAFQGTVSDNQLLLCQKEGDIAWACIVFVKTFQTVNAVLLPLLVEEDSAPRFFNFLKNGKESIDVALMQFEQEHFTLKGATQIIWPKNGILYPD